MLSLKNFIGKEVILTLKRSKVCLTPKHRSFLQTLSLKKVGDIRQCKYTLGMHGMVKQVPYLIDIREVNI